MQKYCRYITGIKGLRLVEAVELASQPKVVKPKAGGLKRLKEPVKEKVFVL
jgi:hypothetical protein